MLNYKAIDIFTSEETRFGNKPLYEAVVQYIRGLKIAARCIVTRGTDGCYESGEVATRRLEILSFNLPVRIYIVLPEAQVQQVLPTLTDMVEDGIVAMHDLQVVSHRVHNAFFPRQLKVRDAMTTAPKSIAAGGPLNEAAGLLLSSVFTGLPVVDEQNRPIGVLTQGDLIRRGGMPLRLGLLAVSDQNKIEGVLSQLSQRRAAEAMTTPAITIAEDRPLPEAVDLMMKKGIKRLPVVNTRGCLVGMLSRLDIFRIVMQEAPDWHSFRAQKIEVSRLRYVGDILRRDTHTVLPDTSIDEVIHVIDRNDIQRVAVVDENGKLLGLISDRDLLHYFKPEEEGIARLLAKAKHPFTKEAVHGDLRRDLAETSARSVMNSNIISVREDMLIEEAIRLMTRQALKRLPVVDEDGRFKGMISRDSLLRTGYLGTS